MAIRIAAIAAAALATALVAVLGPSVETASANPAKFVRCLATPLSVSVVGHGLWGTNERMRGVAVNDWQSAASQQIGTYYSSWSNALGGTIDCHRDLFKVTCIATATPCRS